MTASRKLWDKHRNCSWPNGLTSFWWKSDRYLVTTGKLFNCVCVCVVNSSAALVTLQAQECKFRTVLSTRTSNSTSSRIKTAAHELTSQLEDVSHVFNRLACSIRCYNAAQLMRMLWMLSLLWSQRNNKTSMFVCCCCCM